MSARSSRRKLLVACALAACGKHAPSAPEADPAKVKELAARMANNVPAPVAVPACKDADFVGTVPVTYRTLLELAGEPIANDPEHAAWINPIQLETPTAHVMLDASAEPVAKRRAAAALLGAPAWIVYRIDMVNAPIALGVKELKIGTVGARVIRYDRTGLPTCATVFFAQNDPAKNDWAIAKSDRAIIDPAVAQAMKDDLAQQLIAKAPRSTPATSGSGAR